MLKRSVAVVAEPPTRTHELEISNGDEDDSKDTSGQRLAEKFGRVASTPHARRTPSTVSDRAGARRRWQFEPSWSDEELEDEELDVQKRLGTHQRDSNGKPLPGRMGKLTVCTFGFGQDLDKNIRGSEPRGERVLRAIEMVRRQSISFVLKLAEC